ncbi:MAG: hypothetical protein V1723_04445, partial [Candidatus Uhrbacteria bacterium]
MVEVETPHDSFRKFFTHPVLQGCVLVALATIVAFVIQVPDRFPDPDSFYHAGMAELAASGTFPQTFPWLDLTVLRDRYADLHFLYHLILVPFIHFFGPMSGIQIATGAASVLLTLAWFIALRCLRVRGALFFTLLLLGSAAFLFRIHLAKAQGFALIVLAIGIAVVLRRSTLGAFLAAAFAMWLSPHWPVLAVVTAAFALTHAITTIVGAPRAWRAILCSFKESSVIVLSVALGFAAGLIVNPYFPLDAAITKIQLVDVALRVGTNAVPAGIEWNALPWHELFGAIGFLIPLIILAFAGMIAGAIQLTRREEIDDRDYLARTLALGIAAATFVLLAHEQQRQIEFAIPLLVAFVAVGIQPIVTWMWPPRLQVGWRRPGMVRRPIFTALLVVAFLGFVAGGARTVLAQREYYATGYPATYLRNAAVWLREQAPADAIVYYANWGAFPPLFLWNRQQRYLVGLDPRFAVLADAEKTRLWLAIGRGEIPKPARTIAEHFGATYALVLINEPLDTLLATDRRAKLAHEDAEAKVYQLEGARP